MDFGLVTRAQHGDEAAFASLAVAAGNRLHAVAFRILRDTDLAEDATQQALLTVARARPIPSSHAASTMFCAALPRSHMIDLPRGLFGSGVTSATAAAAPARCPAYRPTAASSRKRSRPCTEMKTQRCSFLDD